MTRCDEALARLNQMRAGIQAERQRESTVRTEMLSVLKDPGVRKRSRKPSGKDVSKRKKYAWKHKFVCLAYVGQSRIPTTEGDKDELFEAGLGEKDVEFESLNLSAEKFKAVLIEAFPQLCAAGEHCVCIGQWQHALGLP